MDEPCTNRMVPAVCCGSPAHFSNMESLAPLSLIVQWSSPLSAAAGFVISFIIHLHVFLGCGAARSGAPLIRDRRRLGACNDPGSAAHHSAALRAALRPGNKFSLINESDVVGLDHLSPFGDFRLHEGGKDGLG